MPKFLVDIPTRPVSLSLSQSPVFQDLAVKLGIQGHAKVRHLGDQHHLNILVPPPPGEVLQDWATNPDGLFLWSAGIEPRAKFATNQCFGSAKVFMRIRIQDPKHVHMDTDPRR